MRALAQLQGVRGLLAPMPLKAVLTSPSDCERRLRAHLRCVLGRQQHMRIVVSALKALRKQAPEAALAAWKAALARAAEEADVEREGIAALFQADPKNASDKSMTVYVTDLQTMLAERAIRSAPGRYHEQLRQACAHEGSEKNHVERLISVFKRNPELKASHPEAYAAWAAARSEHTVRFEQRAMRNLPTPAQARNIVSLGECDRKLAAPSAAPDPHATLQSSQALVLLAYFCSMPCKRAEVGTVAIFETMPTAEQAAAEPNYIVLDAAIMHLGQHKTARHQGAVREDLTLEFMRVLGASLALWPRQHLFLNANNEPFTRKKRLVKVGAAHHGPDV